MTNKAVVKSYFWIHFPHFRHETPHSTCHRWCPICADIKTVFPLQSIFMKIFVTQNTSSPVAHSRSSLQKKKLLVIKSPLKYWMLAISLA
jgi:hypothetical protein